MELIACLIYLYIDRPTPPPPSPLVIHANTPPQQDKTKLEPEEIFFEGAPHWTEVVVPTISILTVIGIIPFASSIARQIWVGRPVWLSGWWSGVEWILWGMLDRLMIEAGMSYVSYTPSVSKAGWCMLRHAFPTYTNIMPPRVQSPSPPPPKPTTTPGQV